MKRKLPPPPPIKMFHTLMMTYLERTAERINDWSFMDRSRKKPTYFRRKRKMPFAKLVAFILCMGKTSIQNALNRLFRQLGESTYMTEQSFSEARQKIKWTAFCELYTMTVSTAYEGYVERWHGYRVTAADGSKLALPSDEVLRAYFGVSGAGSTSVTAQCSILYDIYNKVVVDAQIEPMSVGERELASRHIKALERLSSFGKELILFDRGYPSYELIHELTEKQIKFVMRVKRKWNTEIDESNLADDTVTLCPAPGLPFIDVRVLKFALPSGEEEVLITNIQDKRMGIAAFKELYFKRWPIETKYDEVKNKLEIENLSGRTVDSIRQDFYATMYLANIAAAAYWEAQAHVDMVREGKDNKYKYHVNVNHEIGVLKDDFIRALLEEDPDLRSKMVSDILMLLAKRVVPFRPNRSLPRNQSPRKAKFHHNQKSTC